MSLFSVSELEFLITLFKVLKIYAFKIHIVLIKTGSGRNIIRRQFTRILHVNYLLLIFQRYSFEPYNRYVATVFRGANEFTGLSDIVNGLFCNLCALTLGLKLYISSLHGVDESK